MPVNELHVVVDTNVLLESNTQFWNLITGKGKKLNIFNSDNYKDFKIQICILQTILEELDGLKKNITENVGYYQRKTIQKLFLHINDIKFLQDNLSNLDSRFTQNTQDNVILNSTIELQISQPNTKVILYTNDIQLLLKQKIYNVETLTDIEKTDINSVKSNVNYKLLSDEEVDLYQDTIHRMLQTGSDHNDILKLEKGYTILQQKDGNLNIPVKCVNKELITKIDLTQSYHYDKTCKKILPKNPEQQILLDGMMDDNIKIITSLSSSGTGKTLIQLYGQIQLLSLHDSLRKYNKIVYVVNPSMSQQKHKELGYLPGTRHEKILPFMQGILDNLNYLFNDKVPDEYNIEENEKTDFFEIRPINFIRGSSISKSIVIVDEQQNLTGLEIKTVFSRVQDNSKFILIGDIGQVDEHIAIDYTGVVRLINSMNRKKDKLPWLNISLTKSIRSDIINILDDYFNNIFEE